MLDLAMHSPIAAETSFTIYYLSEQAITIEFGQEIAGHLLDAVSGFNTLLQQQSFPGLVSTVPAYATLTVFYDPMIVMRSDLPGMDCFEKVSAYLQGLNIKSKSGKSIKGDIITIPVCYGAEFGPDLQEVADTNNLSGDEVIRLHSTAVYKVYMIGFVPGFAYLGGMDERLATPRKATPRKGYLPELSA
jgi:inhibitor of KinA